jgi:hypothetical protein
MKKVSAISLCALALALPIAAFAQSSPSPNNTAGTGISPTVSAPTDMGIGAADSTRVGVPSRPSGTVGEGLGESRGYRGEGLDRSGAAPMDRGRMGDQMSDPDER